MTSEEPKTPEKKGDAKMETPDAPIKHNDKRDMILNDIPHSSLRDVGVAFLLDLVERLGNEGAKMWLKDSISQRAAEHITDDIVDAAESVLLGNWVPPKDDGNPAKTKLSFCC
jgi:hypothetical protein